MDGWFDAATAGNTEYLEENIDLLGGSTTETGCSGLIRAIYAHKLASVEVLAAREYKIPDVSNKYPIEIALKLYYYDACFILLMLHPDKSFETRVKKLKEQYDSETITKKELNKRLGELTDEFVIGIRDCTLSPGYVSRISSVASEDVLLTLEEQSVQSFPPDDMGNDFVKEEAGKQKTLEDFEGTGEQDIDKQDVNDKKNFSEEKSTSSGEEKEEKKLVDSEHSIESSDEEASKKSETTPRPKKGCCRCM